MFPALVLPILIQATLTSGQLITVDNGGFRGKWGPSQFCPPLTLVKGFSLKVERQLGSSEDDTALNGIRLYCANLFSKVYVDSITSTEGPWGEWGSIFGCQRGFMRNFALQVEPPPGNGDNTAANNIKFQCTDGAIIFGVGGPWGSYGSWSKPCLNGICGIQTQVEPQQGRDDDTALNDVRFHCC